MADEHDAIGVEAGFAITIDIECKEELLRGELITFCKGELVDAGDGVGAIGAAMAGVAEPVGAPQDGIILQADVVIRAFA